MSGRSPLCFTSAGCLPRGENFLLYDFYRPDGSVDENVFAYSNRRGEHRALHHLPQLFASTYGTIHVSASYADKGAGHLRQQKTLGGAFGLPNDGNLFLAFRDNSTGMEHLERASKIVSQGYSLELHAYNCHVFLNWRELRPDQNYRWDLLCDSLNSRGCCQTWTTRCKPSKWASVARLTGRIAATRSGDRAGRASRSHYPHAVMRARSLRRQPSSCSV